MIQGSVHPHDLLLRYAGFRVSYSSRRRRLSPDMPPLFSDSLSIFYYINYFCSILR